MIATGELSRATEDLLSFYGIWLLVAVGFAWRSGLVSVLMIHSAGGEDFTTELGLSAEPTRQDESREALTNCFKYWVVFVVFTDLVFSLPFGTDFITVFQNDLPLGIVIALVQLVLIAAIIFLGLGSFRDSVGDYTIEGDRTAIDRRWQQQARQVQIGAYGIFVWLGGMALTLIWLFFLHRSLTQSV